MRKKIATLLLAFALILPCSWLFTACDNDDDKNNAKVTSIAVELTSTDYTMTDNTITIPWGDKVELDSSDFTVTATMDNGEEIEIPEKTDTKDGYTLSSTIPSDATTPIGDYLLTFSHEHIEEDVKVDVKVVKANVNMSSVEWNYTDSFTYDKTEKEVELTGLPNGVDVEYKKSYQQQMVMVKLEIVQQMLVLIPQLQFSLIQILNIIMLYLIWY